METPELMKASIELGKILIQNTTQTIINKKEVARAKGDNEETIQSLEEIINNLIAEKNQLIEIAQTYDEHLVSQKISEEDIEYISDGLIPLLENVLEKNKTDEGVKTKESLEMLKPLLAKETFNILQILGFNFKKAIGEPLTLLVNNLISEQITRTAGQSEELKILIEQKELEYFRVLQDKESFERLSQLNQK